jgi:hypothetical protein
MKCEKKRTGGSYHRAKMRRALSTSRVRSGQINKADGAWVQPASITTAPCSLAVYRNGWSGALGRKPIPPFTPKARK